MSTMKTKKKYIAIFMFILICCTGCGTSETESAEETREETVSPSPPTMEGTIETAENLPEKDITVPDYLKGEETEAFPAEEETDGDTVYHLTGEEQAEAAAQVASEIESSINEVLSNKDFYPHITGISVDEGCTEFNVTFTGRDISLYENTLQMSLCMVGNKFQLYQGKSEEELMTVVNYIDSSTGEVFFTAHSNDIQ